MEQKSSPVSNFNSFSILFFVYKWRKQLLILGVSGCVISSIISLGITEKYKSTVILFPGTTYSASKALIADDNLGPDVNEFGNEEEAEQMLQILNSQEVRTKICKKFNLMGHYNIDSTSKLSKTALEEEYKANVNFERTKFMSVRIDVMDTDPLYAAMIANEIAVLHDSARYNITRQRAKMAYQIVEQAYATKEKEVQKLHDSLKTINELGVLHLEVQSKVITEQYAEAIAENNQRGANALQEKLNILSKYGSAYVYISEMALTQREQLNDLKIKLTEAKVDLENSLPQKFVVSSAEPAEKKSYPIRWVIVLVSTISTLVMGIIILSILENIKQLKNN